jgi:hypothetical protein
MVGFLAGVVELGERCAQNAPSQKMEKWMWM